MNSNLEKNIDYLRNSLIVKAHFLHSEVLPLLKASKDEQANYNVSLAYAYIKTAVEKLRQAQATITVRPGVTTIMQQHRPLPNNRDSRPRHHGDCECDICNHHENREYWGAAPPTDDLPSAQN